MAKSLKAGSETGKRPASAKPRAPRKALAEAAAERTPRAGSRRVSRDPAHEERTRMIQEAAYYKAEQRGFEGGSPEQDWLEAEREVDGLLKKRPRGSHPH
jgi:hypothetical protein